MESLEIKDSNDSGNQHSSENRNVKESNQDLLNVNDINEKQNINNLLIENNLAQKEIDNKVEDAENQGKNQEPNKDSQNKNEARQSRSTSLEIMLNEIIHRKSMKISKSRFEIPKQENSD